jgi:hypothetical protein
MSAPQCGGTADGLRSRKRGTPMTDELIEVAVENLGRSEAPGRRREVPAHRLTLVAALLTIWLIPGSTKPIGMRSQARDHSPWLYGSSKSFHLIRQAVDLMVNAARCPREWCVAASESHRPSVPAGRQDTTLGRRQ